MNAEVLKTLLKVSRPVGWSFGPILWAIGFLHSPRKPTVHKTAVIPQLLSFSFPLALVVFGINDVYDYATDLQNPRKTADGLEGTILQPSYHTLVIIAASLATVAILLCSLLTTHPHNTLVICALLILSWGYSAPPLRFKERPLLDSLSNGLIIDLCYLSGFTAGGGLLGWHTFRLKGHILGLCTAGVHALGAVVDLEADSAAGQRTVATVLGADAALTLAAGTYLIAFLIERDLSIFGVYILVGLCIVLAPMVDLGFAHVAFQAVVWWTVFMSAVWFADKALGVVKRRRHAASKSD